MSIVRQISRGDTFNHQVNLVTGPTFEPVTTQEAKDHLRVTHDDDDIEIATMITAARLRIEALSGMRLASQTVDVIAERCSPFGNLTQCCSSPSSGW